MPNPGLETTTMHINPKDVETLTQQTLRAEGLLRYHENGLGEEPQSPYLVGVLNTMGPVLASAWVGRDGMPGQGYWAFWPGMAKKDRPFKWAEMVAALMAMRSL